MTATDELRRMLDERGVRHSDGFPYTTWLSNKGLFTAYENVVDDTLMLSPFTPEQAVEVTLGGDRQAEREVKRLRAENAKLRELVRDIWMALWTCNQHTCKHGNDGCYTEDGNSGGRCTLHDRMYELGVMA